MQEKREEKYPLGGRKQLRHCDHPECGLEGEFRAPKTRQDIQDYYWFCLEHVRDYNAGWNYCEDMDQSDIDTMIKTDLCWGRPTWPLGNGNAATAAHSENQKQSRRTNFNGKIYDPFDVYEEATAHSAKEKKEKRETFRAHPEMEAYLTLGFDYPASEYDVKARYKSLAKDLHPDLKRADGMEGLKAEERLKEVNQAYSQLKKSFSK